MSEKCGCRIIGECEKDGGWGPDFPAAHSIEYCPLHAAAPRMREALKNLEEWVSGIGQDHIPNDIFHNRGGFKIMEAARQALKFAEGKK